LANKPRQKISSVMPITTPRIIETATADRLAVRILGRKIVAKGKAIGQEMIRTVSQGLLTSLGEC